MEWGAIAYFKQSKYGLGLEDIENFNGNILENQQYRNSLKCSTTGNIYGVFEMGGDNQIVMGNVCNIEGDFTPAKSGLSSSTFDKKYYDAYSYSDKNGKLGDATKEVVKEGYTDATFKNWYSDGSYFPSATEDEDFPGITYPWFVRGGGNKDGTGIFAYINSSEGATGQLQALPTHTVLARK